ncbi:YqeG family HAD IIIA-type phosphatase [Synechococcus sp. RSCCF101]|uniref:YqeG family HAD IIIA-type phosphatase n=1 Tax=Synechococcus sp. RSCCF101 TaxID=2511069 RepID=UPI001248CCFF|nr:YqeG family HAD IIIA-type phosphatase [Synechococcus sp. RSCCF101]QEY31653.1 YqeG family HAD IIIA-type phosphatase [Synechococcus sp. RSCCF101]
MLASLLTPDWDTHAVLPGLSIDRLDELGILALVLDVDRTLLPRRSDRLSSEMERWLGLAKSRFHLHLLSNNPSRRRVGGLAGTLEVPFTAAAAKPRRAALRRVLNDLGHPAERVAMIGDRLFTDVLAGNRLGMFTVLVQPVAADGSACSHDWLQATERRLAGWLGMNRSA